MNNPLLDIRQVLIDDGITTPIVIDGFEVDDKILINIQSEPNIIEINQHYRQLSFSIYVKNPDKNAGITEAKNIVNILANKFGRLAGFNTVFFHKIKCISSPYFWGQSSDGSNIYMSKFESVINDTELSSIYIA